MENTITMEELMSTRILVEHLAKGYFAYWEWKSCHREEDFRWPKTGLHSYVVHSHRQSRGQLLLKSISY